MLNKTFPFSVSGHDFPYLKQLRMTTCPKQYLAYNPDFVKVPYLTLTDISQHVIRYKTLLLP